MRKTVGSVAAFMAAVCAVVGGPSCSAGGVAGGLASPSSGTAGVSGTSSSAVDTGAVGGASGSPRVPSR
jgi:hypothetical protein